MVAAFLESGDDKSLKPDFIDDLIILDKPSFFEKIKNVLLYSFIKRKFPLQVSLYLSKKAKKQINELINEEHPIALISDMVRTTEYIKDFSEYKIADLDDRISLRYKRQFDQDLKNVNPYGAFINSLPYIARKIALLKPIKISVLKTEIELLNKYEISIGCKCNRTIFVAQKEADEFNKEIGENKAIAVPIGVDVDYFHPQCRAIKENIISFLGALNVAHNESAVVNFIVNIFPHILSNCPDAKFCIIGGGASEKLLSYRSNNIIFTGRVSDVRPFLSNSKVFVCPMTFGSGIKTKNLEAMSMGLPVVTTSIGAENINAKNKVDWYVTDDSKEFARYVINILNSTEIQNDLSVNARNYILNNFTWIVAKKKFTEVFKEINI